MFFIFPKLNLVLRSFHFTVEIGQFEQYSNVGMCIKETAPYETRNSIVCRAGSIGLWAYKSKSSFPAASEATNYLQINCLSDEY